jgi:hypothetical protein
MVYGIAVATLSGLLRAPPRTEASDAGAEVSVPEALTQSRGKRRCPAVDSGPVPVVAGSTIKCAVY